jgi:hypothetical protein
MSETAGSKRVAAAAPTIKSGTVVQFPGTGPEGEADFVAAVRAAGASAYRLR